MRSIQPVSQKSWLDFKGIIPCYDASTARARAPALLHLWGLWGRWLCKLASVCLHASTGTTLSVVRASLICSFSENLGAFQRECSLIWIYVDHSNPNSIRFCSDLSTDHMSVSALPKHVVTWYGETLTAVSAFMLWLDGLSAVGWWNHEATDGTASQYLTVCIAVVYLITAGFPLDAFVLQNSCIACPATGHGFVTQNEKVIIVESSLFYDFFSSSEFFSMSVIQTSPMRNCVSTVKPGGSRQVKYSTTLVFNNKPWK